MSFKHSRFLLSDHLKPTTSRRSIRQNNNCCLQAKSLCKKVRCARSHADAHTRRRRAPRAVSLSCVPGASSAISTAINCCRATICRRALTEASGLGTKSCFAPPGRRLSTGGWTVRSKQVTHLHGQSTNTKIAPQVPQPQEVKCDHMGASLELLQGATGTTPSAQGEHSRGWIGGVSGSAAIAKGYAISRRRFASAVMSEGHGINAVGQAHTSCPAPAATGSHSFKSRKSASRLEASLAAAAADSRRSNCSRQNPAPAAKPFRSSASDCRNHCRTCGR